jgi:hypothetical protein
MSLPTLTRTGNLTRNHQTSSRTHSCNSGLRAGWDFKVGDIISTDTTAILDSAAVDFVDANDASCAIIHRLWRWHGEDGSSHQEKGEEVGEHCDVCRKIRKRFWPIGVRVCFGIRRSWWRSKSWSEHRRGLYTAGSVCVFLQDSAFNLNTRTKAAAIVCFQSRCPVSA